MREPGQDRAEPKQALQNVRVRLPNEGGLNARAAAMLVRVEKGFDAQLFLKCRDRLVNARSIMEILSLDAAKGTEIMVLAEGPDAEAMLQAVEDLVASRFGEEEQNPRRPGASSSGTQEGRRI